MSSTGGKTGIISMPFEMPGLMAVSLERSEFLVANLTLQESPLWVLPMPAGVPRRLGDLIGHDASWAPDGEQVAYAHGSDIFLAKSDGTGPRTLVSVPGVPWWLRWGPNGRTLRFTVFDPKTNASLLWEVAVEGAPLKPLLPGWNSPPSECFGNWTPDGRYFVFQSTREGATDIWALREGSGFFQRTNPKPVPLTTPSCR